MTFYGGENTVDYGRQLVFDPSTAEMVLNAQRLYANAVYNDYKQSLEDMKEFNEKYGDFQSLIGADQDWWNENVTGRVRDIINSLYAQGIDPLRSALGRAMISQAIANMPYGEMARKRLSAETAKQYAKARGELISNNQWNEDMERYALGGKTLETWDTSKDGVWGRYAPIKAQTMDDIIDPLVKDMDPIFDAELTAQMNDGYNYSTVSRDRIRKVIDDNMPDLIAAGTSGGYYYSKALQAAGGDKDKAKEILKDWYADRASKRVQTKREADQYKLDDHRTKNDNWLDQQKSARDSYYGLITAGADTDGDGKISKEERKAYANLMQNSKKYKNADGSANIFREAEATNGPVGYVADDSAYYNKIDPYNPNVKLLKTKDGNYVYSIPGGQLDSAEIYDTDGNKQSFEGVNGRTVYFIPSGSLEYSDEIVKKGGERKGALANIPNDWYGTKDPGYYIYGTAVYKDSAGETKAILDKDGNPITLKMRVKERGANYGKKQQKN